jgi:hypothetical protein
VIERPKGTGVGATSAWKLKGPAKLSRAGSHARDFHASWVDCGSYSSLVEIPLNPPLLKGDFDSPLRKRGAGGDLDASRLPAAGLGLSYIPLLDSLI